MKFTSLVATGFLVKHSAAAPVASSQHNGTGMCDRGLHIIVARGTLEPGGPGHMGRVAETVAKMIPGSTVSDVDYPASVDYYPSEALGIDALSIMIMEYHNRCPSSRIALMGYSQGAHVVGDVLCGKFLGPQYNKTEPLISSLATTVVAAVMFGDPSHVAGQSWNEGTSQRSGWFPRFNTSACNTYADRMASWCDTGDKYCDCGDSEVVQYGYFEKYTNDAAAFVVSRYAESLAKFPLPDSKSSNKNGHCRPSPPAGHASSHAVFQHVKNTGSMRASRSTLALVVFGLFVLGLVC